MAKKTRAYRRDADEVACIVAEQAIGEPLTPSEKNAPEEQLQADCRNPVAVKLGRLGGKNGGVAPAKTPSCAKRSLIAKEAAEARWRNRRTSDT